MGISRIYKMTVNCIEAFENEQTQFLKRRFSMTNAYACC